MDQSIIASLLDFGALGIFAGFLMWEHAKQQKRFDRLLEDFANEVKRIDEGFDSRAETIRERYEAVISSLRKEHRSEREKLAEKVSDLQRALLARERESVMNFKSFRDESKR